MIDTWSVGSSLIAAAWGVVAVRYVANLRNRPALSPHINVRAGVPLPSLTVIVPGRNERDCIESCIRSLLAQDYPGLSVIAVNDRSQDETGDILNRLRDEFPERLRVLHVEELPAGWFGKPHALEQAMEITRSDLVCFTDADCRYTEPGILRAAVAEMRQRELDLLSITPQFTTPNLWERVTVPCCSEATLVWYCPNKINSPRSSVAYANGAFILARRSEFERIGGWRSVRQQLCEDLSIARWAKSRGLRLGVVSSGGRLRTRSYGRIRDSWNGWSRIFNGALSVQQLSLTLLRMTLLFLVPLVGLVGCLISMATGVGPQPSAVTVAALGIAVALRTACDVALFSVSGASLWLVPLAPLGRLFVMAASARALLAHFGWTNTIWRGAVFTAGRMVNPAQPLARPHTHGLPAGSVSARREAAVQ